MSTANRSKSNSVDVPPDAKPTSESIRLMKLMEGTMSKYDDPKAEAKVKALMEAMGNKATLTEDEVFLSLYDHNYDFDKTLKALKEAEADEAEKWTTVEKKKPTDPRDSAVSPVPSDSNQFRGRKNFNGNARQSTRRAGRSGYRRPVGGRGTPRQRGPRSDRGRGGRPYTVQNDEEVVDMVYNELEEVWDGNLTESQIFTRKIEPSRVSAAEPACTRSTFSPSSNTTLGQPGSWADLAPSKEPHAAEQNEKETVPPVIMPPCSSPVVEGLSFGADYSMGFEHNGGQPEMASMQINFPPYYQQQQQHNIASQNNLHGMQSVYASNDWFCRNGCTVNFPHPLANRFVGYNNGQRMCSTTTTSVMPPHLMSASISEQVNSTTLLDYLTQRLEAAQIQSAFTSTKLPGEYAAPTNPLFMPTNLNRTPDAYSRSVWFPDSGKFELSGNSYETRRSDDNAHMYSLLSQLQGFKSPRQGFFGQDVLLQHGLAAPRNQQPTAGNSWNL